MKSFKNMLMVGLLSALVSVSAHAQVGVAESKFVIDIPFNFYIAGKEYAAGEYAVRRMNSNGLCYLIQRNDRQKTDFPNATIFIVNRREKATTALPAKLVFSINEGQHHLSQVWEQSSNYGGELKVSTQNRQLAAQAQTVTLIAGH